MMIALLAPVPLEGLQGGAMVCAERGSVAYGSRAFETFLQLESLRKGQLNRPRFRGGRLV